MISFRRSKGKESEEAGTENIRGKYKRKQHHHVDRSGPLDIVLRVGSAEEVLPDVMIFCSFTYQLDLL